MSDINNPTDQKLVLSGVQLLKLDSNFTANPKDEACYESKQGGSVIKNYNLEQSNSVTLSDINNYGESSFVILENLPLTSNSDHAAKKHETSTSELLVNPCSSVKSCTVHQTQNENIDSKILPNSLRFGQILHRKLSNSLLQNKNLDNNESLTSTQNGSSHTKKPSPSSSIGNTQQTLVKSKLRSFWNNVKYGWRVKREVNLKLDSVTYLLGVCYHNKSSDDSIIQDASREFKLDLQSKIWLTYRINFPVIPETDLISDSGWGCMLRCGQMMMAQALVCHYLTRDWRMHVGLPSEEQNTYKKILRWFGDTLSETSPFSLHNLVAFGKDYGRKAGDWYGPTHAAQVLRDALYKAKNHHPEMKHLNMYVALDGIVFKQDVIDLCSKPSCTAESGMTRKTAKGCSEPNISNPPSASNKNSSSFSKTLNLSTNQKPLEHCECNDFLKNVSYVDDCPSYSDFGPPSFSSVDSYWSSLIMFVSVRLGNDKINPFYIPCLKSLLAYENCIGIIGGRPKHALYFIGWQEDKLIHMDPHSCQPVVDMEKEDFNEKSFHSGSIRTMSFAEMDPSCAIGFYFRKREEFQHFIEKFSEITAPMRKNLDYPIFALAEGKRIDIEEIDSSNSYSQSFVCSRIDEDDYILL